MIAPERLKADIAVCRGILKKHGTSYFFAAQFLPADLRGWTYCVYAFLRMADDIVDSVSMDPLLKKSRLQEWRNKWQQAFASGESDEPVLEATAYVFSRFGISGGLGDAFLSAMLMDTERTSYRTFDELKEYMYGSAEVVGEMMCHVIGYTDAAAIEYSRMLGRAMQLTNFLRDIREDYDLRGRIYFPLDELERFGLGKDDIAQHRYSPRFTEFVRFQIARARDLYVYADQGVSLLPLRARYGVRLASSFYCAILDKIEQQGGNVFIRRARTSFPGKLMIALRTRKG